MTTSTDSSTPIPDYSYLPETIQTLISIIGYDETLILIRKYGGTYLDIPKNPARASILRTILKPNSVTALCNYYYGERIRYIPKINSILQKTRNAEIIALYGPLSLRDISLRYNLTIYRTYQIIKQHEKQTTKNRLTPHSNTR